jgi:hypothetical protein
MTHCTVAFHRLAIAALLAGAGLAPLAHAADKSAQRLALASPLPVGQPVAAPVAPRRVEPLAAKKVARERSPAVNYERDLWRHQSAS